jgi:hypothetical protein
MILKRISEDFEEDSKKVSKEKFKIYSQWKKYIYGFIKNTIVWITREITMKKHILKMNGQNTLIAGTFATTN